jgi:hypothetical protein
MLARTATGAEKGIIRWLAFRPSENPISHLKGKIIIE